MALKPDKKVCIRIPRELYKYILQFSIDEDITVSRWLMKGIIREIVRKTQQPPIN